jgi:hypothetical protein
MIILYDRLNKTNLNGIREALNDSDIVSKAVEISKALVNTTIGLSSADLEVTRNVGDIARFAITLKNSVTVDGNSLDLMAIAMKIEPRLVKGPILAYMSKEQDWVNVEWEGKKIKQMRINIPPVEDVISALGEKWNLDGPTRIDIGSIKGLSLLSQRPYEMEALKSELILDPDSFEALVDYGCAANYMGIFKSEETSRDTLWSPLYWLRKMGDVEKYLSKQSSDDLIGIADLNKDIKKNQGYPLEFLPMKYADLINAGIGVGFFPSTSVTDRNNRQLEYLFTATPQFEPNIDNDLFERARLIVGCLRHGQYHAEITKIKYPALILQRMRDDDLAPHSYGDVQYAPLRLHNIVNIEETEVYGNTAYKVKWIDSPENNIAADIADLMLRGSDSSMGSADVDAQKVLFQGTFSYTAELRKIRAAKTISSRAEYTRIIERMQGAEL